MKKIIAIIPARSGSKGLPNKNILPLNGKPLLAYSIEAAKKCSLISKIAVSTDSETYKNIAIEFGAEVPALRPVEISEDSSSLSSAIFHLLNFYQEKGEVFDVVVILQPTSPLRSSAHIAEAINKYLKDGIEKAETLVSVVKAPLKSRWLLGASGDYVNFCFDVDKKNPQRQKLSELYLPNGAIYLASVANFDGSFYTDKTLFYEMDESSSVDIDTLEDFESAEAKLLELSRP